jgi:hypothetical protein
LGGGFDTDWLAVDSAGHVGFFAGNDRGQIPATADVARVTEALEAIARAASVRRALGATARDGYRESADLTREPIFDPPCSSRGRSSHESPLPGYPLLVVATHRRLREIAADWNGRELVARDGYAIVFQEIGPMTYAEVHDNDLCTGCRVLDDPSDPRPRAPEALAAAGLYVYAHTSQEGLDPYRRIVGPTVAADLADLEPLVQLVASVVVLAVQFENASSLRPSDLVVCRL